MISKIQYVAISERVEELLKLVDNDTPEDTKDYIELEILSNLIANYEDKNFPMGTPDLNLASSFMIARNKLGPGSRDITPKKMSDLTIKSQRLILRSITEIDIDNVHLLHSLPEVDKFNTLGIPEDIEETKLLLENWITENNKENIQRFTFATELKTDNQFIGVIGLNNRES